MRSARSKTVTLWPALLSWAAAASPAGPEPTTATVFPVRESGRIRRDPALLEAAVDDRALDRFDRHGRLDDAQHARTFARSRTDAAGELGEIVRLVQAVERLAPVIAIDQIVPLGDQVVDGAAGGHVGHQVARVAKRDAAIHAARTLVAQLAGAEVFVELVPIENAQRRIAILRKLSRELGKAGRLAHPYGARSVLRS